VRTGVENQVTVRRGIVMQQILYRASKPFAEQRLKFGWFQRRTPSRVMAGHR
jgi:hypothetical protein